MDSPSAPTTSPKFPSYNAWIDAYGRGEVVDYPEINTSLRRLRWSLDGPLTTSLSVMAHHWINPTLPPDEPYYQPAPSDGTAGSGGNWYPISQDSLAEPNVSSIAIRFVDLARWEENWLEAHEGHYCPDYPGFDSTLTRIGPLPDADPDDPDDRWDEVDGEGTGHLLMCCGVERPRKTESDSRFQFVVEAKGEGGFLTVHDYVEQLHPWLMGLREEILEATAIARANRDYKPFSKGEKLMVDTNGVYVYVMNEKEFISRRRL